MKHGHEVLIVGGGVIGTAVAHYLAKEGADLGLIERGNLACGASGATMGNLSLHNRMPGPWWDLAMMSRSLYEQLAGRLKTDFEFEVVSSLMLIDNIRAVAWAEQRVAIQREAGLDVEFVPQERLKKLDNTVAQDIAGAVYCPLSARVNPFLLCHALAESASEHGATIYRHTEVVGVEVEHGAVTGIRTDRGDNMACDVVVDAAGASADRIAQMAGTYIPVVKNRGVLVVTESVPPVGVRIKGECTEGAAGDRHLNPLESRYDIHLVFSQTKSGNCLIGRSGESDGAGSQGPNSLEAAIGILRRAVRFIPALRYVAIIRTFSGVRPYSPDTLPILGEVEEPRGFVAACGFGDKGIGLGVAGARLVARSILNQSAGVPEVFTPRRFSKKREDNTCFNADSRRC